MKTYNCNILLHKDRILNILKILKIDYYIKCVINTSIYYVVVNTYSVTYFLFKERLHKVDYGVNKR